MGRHTEAGGLGSLAPAIAQASQGAPVPPTLFPPLFFGTPGPQGSSSVAFVFLECVYIAFFEVIPPDVAMVCYHQWFVVTYR